jgi:hypothetical protein
MVSPTQLSEFNVLNSVATLVAGRLVAAGYLPYFHARDTLQVDPVTYHYAYSANQAALLANPGFQTLVANSRGIVTLAGSLPANPRFVSRPTGDGTVRPGDAAALPMMVVSVGSAFAIRPLELGTKVQVWSRHLMIEAFVRTPEEQGRFKDFLAGWFSPMETVPIHDHDSGTLTLLESADIVLPRVQDATVLDVAESLTYEVLLNASLQYAA